MAARKEIREFELLDYSLCQLRVGSDYIVAPRIRVLEEFVKRTLFQVFDLEKIPSAAQCRSLLEAAGKTIGHPGASIVIARRIRDLLVNYKVIQPASPYRLNLGKASILGSYAVLQRIVTKKNAPSEVFLLRCREKIAKVEQTYIKMPDVVSLARWLHLRHSEVSYAAVKVLNFSFDTDLEWVEHFTNERMVRGQLMKVMDAVLAGPGYPAPGVHCDSCTTHACIRQVGGDLKWTT
jgi:hypothetical protein